MRQSRAGTNTQKTLESYDVTFNLGVNQVQIMDLVTCSYLEEKIPVLVVGPSCTGKSYLVFLLTDKDCLEGFDSLYMDFPWPIEDLLTTSADNWYEKHMSFFTNTPLLVLDDRGIGPMTPVKCREFA